jgi:hypothetical protein
MLKRFVPYLSLFSSLGTLLCCALPALLVSLGLGATLVSILGTFPQLIWISERKGFVFGIAGILLAITALLRYQGRQQSCPADPALAAQCQNLKTSGTFLFYGSLVVYLIGAFFAFVAPLLF